MNGQPPRRFIVNFVDGTAEFNDDNTPPAIEYLSVYEHDDLLGDAAAKGFNKGQESLKAQLAAVTKELAHWKAGRLDSHAAEVATLRAALAACQRERDRYMEALDFYARLGVPKGATPCIDFEPDFLVRDPYWQDQGKIARQALKERE